MIALAEFRRVALCKAGSFEASTGDVSISTDDLAQTVASYKALRAKFHAPVKLGHTKPGHMLPKGMPAAGWVENLTLDGDTLYGDLLHVPERIAKLVRAGQYRGRSIELRRSLDVGGKTYSNVLTGLALLGDELPAVRDLDDIIDLYGDEDAARVAAADALPDDNAFTITTGEPNVDLTKLTDKQRKRLCLALSLSETATDDEITSALDTEATDDTDADADGEGEGDADTDSTDADDSSDDSKTSAQRRRDGEEPALSETVAAQQVTIDAQGTELAELRAERKRDQLSAVLDKAVRDGKLLPRQRSKFVALSDGGTDLDTIKSLVDDMPVVVDLTEHGTRDNDPAGVVELTAGEERMLRVMGGTQFGAKALRERVVKGKRLRAGLAPTTED